MTAECFVIEDHVWGKVWHHLLCKVTDHGVTASSYRLFIEAILRRVRTGAPWRDLDPTQKFSIGCWIAGMTAV